MEEVKYILNEGKFVLMLQYKMQLYYKEASKRFQEANPDFKFKKQLSVKQHEILDLYQKAQISIDQIGKEDFDAINEFMLEAKQLDDDTQAGKRQTALFTEKEIRDLLTLNDLEFQKVLIKYGKEEEHLQKS